MGNSIDIYFFEPLLLFPFLFGRLTYGKADLIAINNMNITCNLDTTLKRFLSIVLLILLMYYLG